MNATSTLDPHPAGPTKPAGFNASLPAMIRTFAWISASIALIALAPACGSDDDSSGSGGSGTGGSGTGGTATGGAAGSATGGSAGSATGGSAGSASGGAGGAGGATSTHQACNDAADLTKAAASAIGCKDNSAQLIGLCNTLYAGGKCVTEFEALVTCAKALPATAAAWECTPDGPDFKAGNCDAENTAFDACAP